MTYLQMISTLMLKIRYVVFSFILQHAHALEVLSDKLTDGASALDVGSGSGYLTACFARMVSCEVLLHRFPVTLQNPTRHVHMN